MQSTPPHSLLISPVNSHETRRGPPFHCQERIPAPLQPSGESLMGSSQSSPNPFLVHPAIERRPLAFPRLPFVFSVRSLLLSLFAERTNGFRTAVRYSGSHR